MHSPTMLRMVHRLKRTMETSKESQGRTRDRTEALPCYSTKMWGRRDAEEVEVVAGDRLGGERQGE